MVHDNLGFTVHGSGFGFFTTCDINAKGKV